MAGKASQQTPATSSTPPWGGNFTTSAAYKATTELVFKGMAQPSGYTEPLPHAWRLSTSSEIAIKSVASNEVSIGARGQFDLKKAAPQNYQPENGCVARLELK